MKELPLSTLGYVAFIDDEDYQRVAMFKWYALIARNKDNSIRTVYAANQDYLLHRFIMVVTDPEIVVDHKDHNGLNNLRCNLRVCTQTFNLGNMCKTRGTSMFKGVSWDKDARKWVANIVRNKRQKHLGYFVSEVDAARAYDAAAKDHFGEFALTNF
jgi:hypothetical protein